MKNDVKIIVRLPQEIKTQFRELCDKELIDMSVKIRHIIYKELKKSK
jgi:hypothetical protein